MSSACKTFPFQGITFGSWIFALILTIPMFLVMNVKGNFCESFWPNKWMPMAFSWMWFVLVLLSVALMAGLYAKVVYILWFKSDESDQLTDQQSVRSFIQSTNIFCIDFDKCNALHTRNLLSRRIYKSCAEQKYFNISFALIF